MSKLKKLISAIQATSDAIEILESQGVNVDKIVGVSNAQGPHARILQGAIGGLATALSGVQQDVPSDVDNKLLNASKKTSSASRKKRRSPVQSGRG